MPEENATPEWVSGIEDEADREHLGHFESQDKLFETMGYTPPEAEKINVEWRDQITDEGAKKFAEDSPDINHLVNRGVELRKQVSNAIIKPTDTSNEEQMAAYRKALGVPDKFEDYEFPDLEEGQLTDAVIADRAKWAERFHNMNIPTETAKALSELLNEDTTKVLAAQAEADKLFSEAQEAKLKADWGDDHEKNKTYANRAFKDIAERAGVNLEDLTKIETKDGRFLMDQAEVVRMFATIGREMAEGSLGPVLSESEIDTIDGQIRDLRTQQVEAEGKGDSKLKNKLYQKELALIAKRDGDSNIVGAQGRAA